MSSSTETRRARSRTDSRRHVTTALTGKRQGVVSVFIEVFAPPPHLVIFGAVDFTAALARVAKVLGYRVTVCDARPPVRDKHSLSDGR